jgi:cyclopropane-fatty-acyl-phospholipid synthase
MFSGRSIDQVQKINGLKTALARYVLGSLTSRIDFGHLTIVLPSLEQIEHQGTRPGKTATLVIHRWRTLRRLLSHGADGFVAAYVDGDWSSPDLVTLLEWAAQNNAGLTPKTSGLPHLRLLNLSRHFLRRNTRAGSLRNIAFHYDLGNEFYRAWLDRSMAYSSALYEHPLQTLEDAQKNKLSRIVESLDLRDGAKVLEIGCGWGALATRLARGGSCITAITLSSEQLAFARQRAENENLSEKGRFELSDYRDVEGKYDRIVSIEMLEAVGEAYWPSYFKILHDRLNPGGIVALQAITIDHSRFDAYRRSADFIQRHIFPGGMLPSETVIKQKCAEAGLKLISIHRFGESYATTLAEWRNRFLRSWPAIADMGFQERFRRLWEYYLCYCEAGFRTAMVNVGLYVLSKP